MSTERHDRAARRLRIPRHLAYAMLAAIIGAAVSVASGSAATAPVPSKPSALQTFQLRLGDARSTMSSGVPTFSRTPSFAWAPVRGAARYEFELSTSDSFGAANAVVWSTRKLTTPAVSIPIALPWITGSPASLYWHVQAIGPNGVLSGWSEAKRFNMRWPDTKNRDSAHDTLGVPIQANPGPGAIAWTPVEGATGYEVWYPALGFNHRFQTTTTVADEREFAHRPVGTEIHWRVRAKRALYGATSNKLPRVSYGPWSGIYSTRVARSKTTLLARPLNTVSSEQMFSNTPAMSAGRVKLVSDRVDREHKHAVMPVFLFSHDKYAYHRVYVATDKDCVNVVFKGSPVGGTAYAPRWMPPSKVKQEHLAQVDLWDSSRPGGRYYWTVVPVKKLVGQVAPTLVSAVRYSPPATGVELTWSPLASKDSQVTGYRVYRGTTSGRETLLISVANVTQYVDSTAAANETYYYRVSAVTANGGSARSNEQAVPPSSGTTPTTTNTTTTPAPTPASPSTTAPATTAPQSSNATGANFRDLATPQDACQHFASGAGVRWFRKDSHKPVIASVTGLSPSGRLLSTTSSSTGFYGAPLVTWTPTSGAVGYDVEWSRDQGTRGTHAWRPAGSLNTHASSALLQLQTGTWWYRVRGVDPFLTGNTKMTWSTPKKIVITKPIFNVTR